MANIQEQGYVRRSTRECVVNPPPAPKIVAPLKRDRGGIPEPKVRPQPFLTARGVIKREVGLGILERYDVKNLLRRINENDKDYTVVLKVKDQVSSDVNQVVMDEIISALWRNKVCQAAYLQNLGSAIQDEQLEALIALLKRKPIWCLNIGETYNVSSQMWRKFCMALPETNVTHLYVSEHTIDLALKNKMRDHIRDNRKKHTKHSSMYNLAVIERCTNMWWNPINAIRHQLEAKWQAKEAAKEARRKAREPPPPQQKNRYKAQSVAELKKDPTSAAYWQRGLGKGGDVAWRFECSCLEVCSSYENFLYHPTGTQFQCTGCQKWAHVSCVLGAKITEEDVEELTDVLCHRCSATKRRERLAEMKELGIDYHRVFGRLKPTSAGGGCEAAREGSSESATADMGGSAGGALDHIPDNDSDDNEDAGEGGAQSSTKVGIQKTQKQVEAAEAEHVGKRRRRNA